MPIHSLTAATLAALLLSPAALSAQPRPAETVRAIDALVRAYHDVGAFNGNILVAKDGVVLLDKGYGMASFEQRVPNAPGTKHWIGSVSKVLTATTVMRLVDQGRLSLDSRVSDLLPWYRKETGSRVTVRMLLNHTSGIPDYMHLPGIGREGFSREVGSDPINVKAFVQKWCSADLSGEPGTRWAYSNSGYVVLGAIVEQVTGRPFAHALQELVLDPAGMTATRDLAADPRAVVEGLTPGYQKAVGRIVARQAWNISTAYAAGSMVAPLGDLLRFSQTLDRPGFLSAASRSALFTPGLGNWGCGWEVRTLPLGPGGAERVVEGHEGYIFWSLARIYRIPGERLFIAIVNNTGDAPLPKIFTGVTDLLFGRTPVQPLPPLSRALLPILESKGTPAMVARLREIQVKEAGAWDFAEAALNAFGYELLRDGRAEAAVSVFQLNSELYPRSANVWDSLGEGLAASGRREEAVKAYRKVLDLDPSHSSAKSMLAKLGS
jgi:CubicO group peptidase (beta-lactamase class C family)